MDYTYTER